MFKIGNCLNMLGNVTSHGIIPLFGINRLLPAVPSRFFTSVGSTFLAAALGGAYGLIGRVVYPKAGISPLHYSVWFALAFQIKEFIIAIESNFDHFLGVKDRLEKLEQVPEDELDVNDLIRFHTWKFIQLKNHFIQRVDDIFSKITRIRPFDEVDQDNVAEASFLEMCRFRIWPVFKATILDGMSFSIAHHLSNGLGFTLPNATAVPLLIVIRSIFKDIILVPALHIYVRICNQIANQLDDDSTEDDHHENSINYRAKWIHKCLPSL